MNITIRPAEKSDVPIIRKLILEGIAIWGEGLETNLKPWVDVITTIDYIEKNIVSSQYEIFVAEHEETIVGTISLDYNNPSISHMGGLYCDVKGQGLGTLLLQYAMKSSRDKEYRKMECEIYEGNYPSISLMEKYGAYHADSNTIAEVTYRRYEFNL
ncbi:MAG: GNAT family N-acetyltransferase [Enterococcus sp.]|nr:GNAT family N-acetyltransferase [Enterococcus sp.]